MLRPRLVSLCCLLLVLFGYPWARSQVLLMQYRIPNEAYFGKATYREIGYRPTAEERAAVAPILETAEAIFSYLGDEEGRDPHAGSLATYYLRTRSRQIVSETHEIDFITARHDGQTAHMWVAYQRRGFYADGSLAYGAGSSHEKILALWSLENIDGVWVVTQVREHP